jgi:hypothetical protein
VEKALERDATNRYTKIREFESQLEEIFRDIQGSESESSKGGLVIKPTSQQEAEVTKPSSPETKEVSPPTEPPSVTEPSKTSCNLEVDIQEVPPIKADIQINPVLVDFGKVSDWSFPLPVRDIQLSNPLASADSQAQVIIGTVRSTLPWLEVTPVNFSCTPGKEAVLIVRLTKEAAKLRPKIYDVTDALVIESGGKEHLVNARLEVARMSKAGQLKQPLTQKNVPPETSTAMRPPNLVVDFGTVSDWSFPLPTLDIRLSNTQAQVMIGTVRSTLPWLEVTPANFSCPPGQEVALTVRLTKEAARLRAKTYEVADALVVESGGEEHQVKARLVVAARRVWVAQHRNVEEAGAYQTAQVQQPEGAQVKASKSPQPLPEALVLEPTVLDFGPVCDWSGALPMHEIRLSNGLKTTWSGTLCSTVPWLEVTPTDITCPAGATVTLQARLTTHGARLRPRTYLAHDALVIEGSGQKLLVGARLTVSRTRTDIAQ